MAGWRGGGVALMVQRVENSTVIFPRSKLTLIGSYANIAIGYPDCLKLPIKNHLTDSCDVVPRSDLRGVQVPNDSS